MLSPEQAKLRREWADLRSLIVSGKVIPADLSNFDELVEDFSLWDPDDDVVDSFRHPDGINVTELPNEVVEDLDIIAECYTKGDFSSMAYSFSELMNLLVPKKAKIVAEAGESFAVESPES
ncbi:MAG: hypothetical protein NTW79_03700 [Candidatus Berkelbacteria bacterium]|nr:hypothetical protein [Candidatus Berkelbacteria bacterium]